MPCVTKLLAGVRLAVQLGSVALEELGAIKLSSARTLAGRYKRYKASLIWPDALVGELVLYLIPGRGYL